MNQKDNSSDTLLLTIFGILILFVVLQQGWEQVQVWIEQQNEEVYQSAFFSVFFWIQVVSLVVSVVLLALIVYATIRLTLIRGKEKKEAEELYNAYIRNQASHTRNSEWERVKERIDSDNPDEWRLAILDADVLLERIVDRMQYQGDTLSEKLRQIERSDFNTIDEAWEAHKMRNRIAHEGEDFTLTHREARRVIGLYEQVFREFHYV